MVYMKTFNDDLKKQLKNPEFAKAYDELEPEYERIEQIIKVAGSRVYQRPAGSETSDKKEG